MLDRTLCVAPMMGCTDRHYRYLLRRISPHALLYTEMVVSGALMHGDRERFLRHAADEPCALQLGGSDPAALRRCAVMAEQAGYQEVNLNVGCPSDRVQHGGIGACLMANPRLVAECVAEMQSAVTIPVTVKSRVGIDERDDYEFFHDFVSAVYDGGCRVFIVHARKAVLTGLTPKENREVPPLRYDYVERIRRDFPECTFILNGGIRDAPSAVALLDRVDGIMLGRAVYADPWILAALEASLYGHPAADRLAVLSDYRDYIDHQMDQGENFKHMARHLLGYFSGWRGAKAFRKRLSDEMFGNSVDSTPIEDALSSSGIDRSYGTQAIMETRM